VSDRTGVALADPVEAARLARACSRSVMIATPVYRDVSWRYTLSLVKTTMLLQQLDIRAETRFVVGQSNLPRARNQLAAEFLASDHTDLIFIDSDMGWNAGDVVRLLASGQDLIGGAGCRRIDRPDADPDKWCCRLLPDSEERLSLDEMNAVEVLAIGTGFLRISRRVFEAMIEAHPEWKRDGGKGMPEPVRAAYHQFFRFDPDCPNETSEDYHFCDRWRTLGGRVWLDTEIALTHVGTHEYGGSIAAIFTAPAA